ncbi:hypothetical protein AN640_07780 [Candidatus Epulonipiscium fishelsonii]|uniref:Uncharacterized protein n=1 Tax=Candidatus Epulonipiscium fishelsonii TaxID=77094 RepID=A0ACC8XEW9_9FIRM|nr:hypothetical protein AN640_07780 [Epulopiscium sp. SCG-D08WGA-EpuloA1]
MSENKDYIKQKFNKEVINTYKRIATEVKYKSSGLLAQINKYGGYEASIKYIMTDANTVDFGVLWEFQRLDLSIEALIIKQDYKSLFPDYILEFCENRLKEYNYAPNNIAPKHVELKKDLIENNNLTEEIKPAYNWNEVRISTSMWEDLFLNEKVFTQKNQDLFLRIYLVGGKCIQSTDLAIEEGYSEKYPFKEVIASLSKRIKAHTKIEPPKIKEEILWWNVVFIGWFNSNKSFEWTLAPKLFAAIDNLNNSNKIDTSKINLKMDTNEINKRGENMEKKPKVKSIDDFVMDLFADISTKEPKLKTDEEKIDIASIEQNINNILKQDSVVECNDAEEKVEVAYKQNIEDIPKKEKIDIVVIKQDNNTVTEKEKMDTSYTKEKIDNIIEKANSISSFKEEKVEIEKIKIWEDLKTVCLDYYGAICEVCGIDYGYTYGNQFERYIDIHNLKSTHKEDDNLDINPEEDLVPVCHNCHFIMHTKQPCYTIDEMKKICEENGK